MSAPLPQPDESGRLVVEVLLHRLRLAAREVRGHTRDCRCLPCRRIRLLDALVAEMLGDESQPA